MPQHLTTKREAKTGFQRIGAIVAVLAVMVVAVMIISTMMSTVRTAADPNTPSVDVRTSGIQEAKQRPPT